MEIIEDNKSLAPWSKVEGKSGGFSLPLENNWAEQSGGSGDGITYGNSEGYSKEVTLYTV